jgi:DNA-binding MarR family transcriptional regulator
MQSPRAQVDHVDRMIEAWSAREPALDVQPLQVVGRLLRLAGLLERDIERELAAFELSFGDFDVLNTLRREAGPEGMHPTHLARTALITTGAMTTRLNRLEQRRLLIREADGTDRRAVRVRLTALGRDRVGVALRAVLAADRRFLAPLGKQDRAAIAGLLRRWLLAVEPE